MRPRYSVFVNNCKRPEVFAHGQFAEAFTLAEQLGGYVMDWWRWEKLYPPVAPGMLRVAVGT